MPELIPLHAHLKLMPRRYPEQRMRGRDRTGITRMVGAPTAAGYRPVDENKILEITCLADTEPMTCRRQDTRCYAEVQNPDVGSISASCQGVVGPVST